MLLKLKNVNIAFGEKRVINNLNLGIAKTDRILLLGANGSGKTTLIKYICEAYKDKCKISYLRQKDMLLPYLTAFKNLELVGGSKRAEELIKKLKLEDYKKSYPYQLSGGVHRAFLVLRALLFDYELLILDEPLANLDNAMALAVLDLVKSETEGRAVIITSHRNIDELNFTNKTVLV